MPIAPTAAGAVPFVSCGPPKHGAEVRIVDSFGVVLPERSVGEIEVRCNYRMREYHRRPDLTQAAFRDQHPSYPLRDDEPLMSGGLIDSFCVAHLGVFIEQAWNAYIPDPELTVESMDTLKLNRCESSARVRTSPRLCPCLRLPKSMRCVAPVGAQGPNVKAEPGHLRSFLPWASRSDIVAMKH